MGVDWWGGVSSPWHEEVGMDAGWNDGDVAGAEMSPALRAPTMGNVRRSGTRIRI